MDPNRPYHRPAFGRHLIPSRRAVLFALLLFLILCLLWLKWASPGRDNVVVVFEEFFTGPDGRRHGRFRITNHSIHSLEACWFRGHRMPVSVKGLFSQLPTIEPGRTHRFEVSLPGDPCLPNEKEPRNVRLSSESRALFPSGWFVSIFISPAESKIQRLMEDALFRLRVDGFFGPTLRFHWEEEPAATQARVESARERNP